MTPENAGREKPKNVSEEKLEKTLPPLRAEEINVDRAKKLTGAIIKQAVRDILNYKEKAGEKGVENKEKLKAAAVYLFSGDQKLRREAADPRSFESACERINAVPQKAAEGIWRNLPPDKKRLVIEALKEADFEPADYMLTNP